VASRSTVVFFFNDPPHGITLCCRLASNNTKRAKPSEKIRICNTKPPSMGWWAQRTPAPRDPVQSPGQGIRPRNTPVMPWNGTSAETSCFGSGSSKARLAKSI